IDTDIIPRFFLNVNTPSTFLSPERKKLTDSSLSRPLRHRNATKKITARRDFLSDYLYLRFLAASDFFFRLTLGFS
ncbi:MAG: hypothetical protein LUJ25_05360, partial [Firmicutes bacterium]|nr:hypothetical protein [Bacillota bacterium]